MGTLAALYISNNAASVPNFQIGNTSFVGTLVALYINNNAASVPNFQIGNTSFVGTLAALYISNNAASVPKLMSHRNDMYLKFLSRQSKLANVRTLSSAISHLTDVEGNLNYLTKWASNSDIINFEQGVLSFRNLAQKQYKFIYGGDFSDKGPGDLRIGQALTAFKQAHPAQVDLIAGNREIKCRRFTYELDPKHIRQRLLTGQAAFWRQQSTPKDYVIQHMQHHNSNLAIDQYVKRLSIEQCQTLYLQWMLTETMGCGAVNNKPSTFEYRRQELAELSGQTPDNIDDERVTQSFIDSVAPDGVVTRYLKQAQLGVIDDETLFIHGAVTLANIGYVPDSPVRITDAREWIAHLNQWYKQQIIAWDNQRVESNIQPPGQQPLDRYVIFNPQSIVTTNWYQNNRLAPIPKQVVDYLNKAGIYRVITGHQPFSDFPLIIRAPSLDVIVGDTSYSDINAQNDNRGNAWHHLALLGSGRQRQVVIDAERKNGVRIEQLVLPSREAVEDHQDIAIGHFTDDERLIRPGYEGLVASQLDGFAVKDEMLTTSSVLARPLR